MIPNLLLYDFQKSFQIEVPIIFLIKSSSACGLSLHRLQVYSEKRVVKVSLQILRSIVQMIFVYSCIKPNMSAPLSCAGQSFRDILTYWPRNDEQVCQYTPERVHHLSAHHTEPMVLLMYGHNTRAMYTYILLMARLYNIGLNPIPFKRIRFLVAFHLSRRLNKYFMIISRRLAKLL